MSTHTGRRWGALAQRWDRVFRWSMVLAVLIHVLIILLFRTGVVVPDVPTAAAGDDANDASAAAGGGAELIAFRIATPPPTPEPIPKPPIPIPVPDAKVVAPPQEPVQVPVVTPGAATAAGEGRGREAGPGTETGTGRGDAGSGDAGLNRIMPPSPRGLILPPSDRPGRVRGKTVSVYVFVTDRGRVQPDSTRINPGTGDTKFDARLIKQASEWVFHPAQRDGRPVPGWFEYTITL